MNIGIIDIGLTSLLSDCIKVSTDDNNPIQIVVRFNAKAVTVSAY